ncbi:MAG: ribulose-phosphate 3-epimerase [Acidobacteriota bacterium]
MALLAPSILSADFMRLGAEVKAIEEGGAGMVHIDVMDGHFVPNITVGPVVVEWMRNITNLPIDVHLMIENPDSHMDAFLNAGADFISVHQEAVKHLHRTIDHIKSKRAKAGVAINPATPLSTIVDILHDVDFVLIMSVNPGFGGQKFIVSALRKAKDLKLLIDRDHSATKIEIDGGIREENLRELRDAGADYIVAGSSVFRSGNPRETVKRFVRILAEER